MTISRQAKDLLLLYWQRRWAMLFLNLAAGLFAAPLLYWSYIFMPVVLGAANDTPILLGMFVFSAAGGFALLLPAALGLGGCFSAMRKILAGEYQSLPKNIGQGIVRCAGTSLLAGFLAGGSVLVMQVGLAGLYAIPGTPGVLRGIFAALLTLQTFWALALGLCMLSQPDALQRRPLRCMFAAVRQIAAHSLRYAMLCGATMLTLILLFAWHKPLITLFGFLLAELLLFAPIILLWQKQGTDSLPEGVGLPGQHKTSKNAGCITVMGICFTLDVCAVLLPFLWRREFPGRAVMANLRQTVDFIIRQTLLEANNGTLREMLASSGVWPLLFATLLGCACCVMTAYACACYSFRLRGLAFAGAAALQVLPILSGYAGLELLLDGWFPADPLLLGIVWITLYLFILMMLYRKFRRLTPALHKNKEAQPGVRLFFYYALPRVRHWVYALALVSTLGCWNDALAPFRYMQALGAFSLTGYLWEHTQLWEHAVYPAIFFALLAAVLTMGQRYAKMNKT